MDHSKRYLDGTYADTNEGWHLEDAPWKISQIDRLLRQSPVPIHQAVEVGCGAGGIVSGLARMYPEIGFEGYDISPDAARLWSADQPANLILRQADFLSESNIYDLLLLIDVFEHVPDYLGFLSQIRDRSKAFIFNVPLDMHVAGLLTSNQTRARAKYGHLHYFSEDTAIATLTDAGYQVNTKILANGFMGVPRTSARATSRQRLIYPFRRAAHFINPKWTARLLGGYSLYVLATP